MEYKSLLFESDINNICFLINENQNSFEDIWDSIRKQLSNSIKNVSSKEEAVEYIIKIYNKTKSFPSLIRTKTLKYVILILIGIFGFGAIINSLPSEFETVKKEIVQSQVPQKTKEFSAPIKSSNNLSNFIKAEEGLRLKVYDIKDGMLTVGWGHAEDKHHTKMRVGKKISKEKAEKLLISDIKEAEEGLNKILNNWKSSGLKLTINQNMYDAMISMIFNMGIGNFRESEFVQLVKKNKMQEAKEKILTTNVTYEGHKSRRQKESEMFGKNISPNTYLANVTLREFIRRKVAEVLS